MGEQSERDVEAVETRRRWRASGSQVGRGDVRSEAAQTGRTRCRRGRSPRRWAPILVTVWRIVGHVGVDSAAVKPMRGSFGLMWAACPESITQGEEAWRQGRRNALCARRLAIERRVSIVVAMQGHLPVPPQPHVPIGLAPVIGYIATRGPQPLDALTPVEREWWEIDDGEDAEWDSRRPAIVKVTAIVVSVSLVLAGLGPSRRHPFGAATR